MAALLLVGGLFAPTPPGIGILDATAGNVVFCRALPPPQRLALVYRHSMYGGDVVEEYVATPERTLRRVSMTTDNAAAAEYYAPSGNVTRAGARFLVDVPPADYPEIVVRVGRIGAHRLRLEGTTLDLLAMTGDRHQVRLRPRSTSVTARLLGGGC